MKNELRLTLGKWAIWLALAGVIYLLRSLLPIIFLTFVLTYIANTLVRLLTRVSKRRRINVVAVYASFLLLLTGAGVLLVPRMFKEARHLAVQYIVQDTATGPQGGAPDETLIDRHTRKYVDSIVTQVVGRQVFDSYSRSEEYQALVNRIEASIRTFVPKVIALVRAFANASLSIVMQFLVSIILSFLILWDLPSLQEGVRSLSTGKTADIYAEIAPGMKAFGLILGRALEAQTGIAIVNAVLTSVGFLVLGIPSIALLAAIVFFCSYIPVVGVMLSTVPAALLAFTTGGVALVFWLVVMVLIVHAIEAYALNPLIYGHHMKMHPVVILVILLVGEHLFGIWGLLLGVPAAAFVRGYVLKGEPSEPLPSVQPKEIS